MKNEILLGEYVQKVWNEKNFDRIPSYVSPAYTIFADPSDPWESMILNFEEFAMRLDYTFDSFPDIRFEILTAIPEVNFVAITWLMTGTNIGKNGVFPPTGKSIRTVGATGQVNILDLLKGLFSIFINLAGEEKTTYSLGAIKFIASLISFLKRVPARENIRAVVNSSIWIIGREEFKKTTSNYTCF